MILPALTGFAAGALHVVSGPDHLVALAPLAARDRRRALRVGTIWGIGHGAGVVGVGLLGIVARDHVPIDAISGWAEFSVGGLLICIGLWALWRATRVVIHVHPHEHAIAHEIGAEEQKLHAHIHAHPRTIDHDKPEAHGAHSRAAFGVGLLHGVAGTGHLLGIVPSLALPPAQAVVYLIAYLVAAVGSMAGFGLLVGVVTERAGPLWLGWIMRASGVAAVAVGIVWLTVSWPIGS